MAELRGLDPRALFALQVMQEIFRQLGLPFWITSAVRDSKTQAQLYAKWKAGKSKYPAAPPGKSKHERGLAFDIGTTKRGFEMGGFLAPYIGLRWGGTFSDPDEVHFELL